LTGSCALIACEAHVVSDNWRKQPLRVKVWVNAGDSFAEIGDVTQRLFRIRYLFKVKGAQFVSQSSHFAIGK